MTRQELLAPFQTPHGNVLFAWAESRHLMIKIHLCLYLLCLLQFVFKQVESSPSSPPSRLHLLLPLFAPLGQLWLRLLINAWNGIRNGKVRLLVSEILCSPCHNSFERFLHCCSLVLGVVRGLSFLTLLCSVASFFIISRFCSASFPLFLFFPTDVLVDFTGFYVTKIGCLLVHLTFFLEDVYCRHENKNQYYFY